MTIQGCNIYRAPTVNLNDPAGTGIPFSPFTYSTKPDTFERTTNTGEENSESSTESEGFTFNKAVGSFWEGVKAPFVEMLKHPFATLGTAAGLGLAIRKVPGLGKVVGLAGLALGGIQMLSGLGKTASGYFGGNTEQAEEGCKEMGTGTVSTLFSAVNLKSPEAPSLGKISGKLKGNQLSLVEKIKVAFGIKPNKPLTYQLLAKKTAKEFPGALFTGARYEVPATPYFSSTLSSKKSEGESGGESSSEGGEEEPLTFKIADDALNKLAQ